MKPLSAQHETQAKKAGDEQRDGLLEALENNPSIKRLAVNPLMLTILALIQRSGRTLPHRRIELYQVVTRTLLDNWNKEKGNRVFEVEEIPLAEQLLGDLAFRLHSSDPVLTEQDVKKIASQTMDTFYQRSRGQTKDAAAQEFIETLRSSSGLFVESGQGLFSFMHRTFEEYYVALYLLRKPSEELKQFIIENHTRSTWHEPLLLTIAYKSVQGNKEERHQASELIEAIASSKDDYESVLQRSLLFAAYCVVDCSAWSIKSSLQQDLANRLFELYGDLLGNGRYTQLQQDLEKVALSWLRGQPLGSGQQDIIPPLLSAWREVLVNTDDPNALRQEGAVHLLASIAPDLASCPKSVLHALIPVLLHLAGVQDWYRYDLSCPPEIRAQLFQTTALPWSLEVEEYALVALHLLDAAGPAGWLRDDWRKWGEEQPELLQRLTQHSLEIDYLLAPAAFPATSNDPNWDKQIKIANEWKQIGQRNPFALQVQLLQSSETARYPHAYLFEQMLVNELASPATPWRETWDSHLQKEMAYGRSTTYQVCLNLRLMLCEGNDLKRRGIANELLADLSKQGQQQTQALITISNLYVQEPRYLLDLLILRDPLDLRYLLNLLNLLNLLDLRYLLDPLDLRNLRYMLNLLDLRDLRYLGYLRYMLRLLKLRYIRFMPKRDKIVSVLCRILKQQTGILSSTVLFALYSVINSYNQIPQATVQQVCNDIQAFQGQGRPLPIEQSQLIEVILRRIGKSSTTSGQPKQIVFSGTPDDRATRLNALKQKDRLRKSDVEEILAACNDTRTLSQEKWNELIQAREDYSAGTVSQFAWRLLSQPFNIEAEGLYSVAQALDDGDAVACAAAALLLQHCKKIPQNVREDAAERILRILADEELSRRPLDPPEYSKIWRLDDVLFETLRGLAE